MRVVVVGATGNIGTSLLEALAGDSRVDSVVGIARRVPAESRPGVQWVGADIRTDELETWFHGADVVVHLAWLFQPARQPLTTWRNNVGGTERVLRAVSAAQVPAFVYASSVGAYAPCADDRMVPESWPTDGWPAAGYMREKAYVERLLDRFEVEEPERRVVRMRPAFSFRRESAGQQRRLFLGPLMPNRLVRPGLPPILPIPRGLRFQAVHSRDVGAAYALAVTSQARGPFNLAAEPVVDPGVLRTVMGARTVTVPPRLVRTALSAAWHSHLVPATPDLFDAMMNLPLMDTARAREDLGWIPRYSSAAALREMLDGLRTGAGAGTPPLDPHAGGPWRIHEFTTGVGSREEAELRV
ncbi:NAD-dependent epimerase/dehydratase family protein [Nocardia asteroides NBRC 15531]|uniref:NAD-dependent epimerase/dehydratase family protein n=1 Tax=Nocardia asteroides NBRC 15531 TaxID=1110697 RepID=U5E7I1_NOCAS|nr:NAD-dependent epimerase/dehydratase family protein [Nocardia asteroides]TLF66606.1 NAD-dependent epimerase/dehydratase family protein [Nocardia asteroides NBRC 15531]UGT46294.1 NAD-dependent epimerase/dehydratase family protein [Nocardia asteroides]SFM95834.1 Nucleoside-diphosphate-sugar epimerase [Nocardia asteroides]VEG34901.1 UDP-glucose 4-epimerase [Nocardia asteroides]GAD82373.1 NAD-dependent epimerase/dehydratase family protein [Nocardia asteroides NBRC 15531]